MAADAHRPAGSGARAEKLALAGILLLAAALRLYRLDVLDVRFDEASGLQNALTIAGGALLKVASFSGSVAVHPPVYAYTLALPYLLTRDFVAIAAFRALLDVLAIAGLWLLCSRALNARVAMLAALLFAVAPWAVLFARKTWLAPLPIYHMLLMWGLLEVAQLRRARGWAITGLGLALSIGTHLSAAYLLPVTLIALWLGRRTARPVPMLLGLAPLAVLAAAYLSHDAPGGFSNIRALAGAAGLTVRPEFSLQALQFALWSSGGAHVSDLTSAALPAWLAQAPVWLAAIDSLQMAVLVGTVLVVAVSLVRRALPWMPAAAVALAWVLLPILLQIRPSRPLQIHYLLVIYPAVFVVMGMAIDRVLRLDGAKPIQGVVALIVAIIVGWQVFTTVRFADFVAVHDTSNGGYGPPVRAALAAARLAREALWRGETPDVIVVAPGGDPAVGEQAALLDVLLADVPHRFVRAEDGMIVRGDRAQYVFAPGTDEAQALLRDLAPVQQTEHFSVYDGDARAYLRVNMAATHLAGYQPLTVQWANGAQLIGYRSARAGDLLILDAFISVTREAGGDVHWFARAMAGDAVITSVDIGGIHPSAWRVGDVLVLRFRLPFSADSTALSGVRLGAYEFPAIKQIATLDAAGNPADDGVTLVLGP